MFERAKIRLPNTWTGPICALTWPNTNCLWPKNTRNRRKSKRDTNKIGDKSPRSCLAAWNATESETFGDIRSMPNRSRYRYFKSQFQLNERKPNGAKKNVEKKNVKNRSAHMSKAVAKSTTQQQPLAASILFQFQLIVVQSPWIIQFLELPCMKSDRDSCRTGKKRVQTGRSEEYGTWTYFRHCLWLLLLFL